MGVYSTFLKEGNILRLLISSRKSTGYNDPSQHKCDTHRDYQCNSKVTSTRNQGSSTLLSLQDRPALECLGRRADDACRPFPHPGGLREAGSP